MESSVVVRGFSEDGRRHLLADFDVTEMTARLASAEYRFHVAECGTMLIAVAGVRGRSHLAVGAVQEKNGVTFQPMEWARHTV
jgi:hypothetical protein